MSQSREALLDYAVRLAMRQFHLNQMDGWWMPVIWLTVGEAPRAFLTRVRANFAMVAANAESAERVYQELRGSARGA